ncbi:MAG: CotH kinase family protein [Oscillospiraceae bacterium]|nr:CotH kinase family protein [Oscillospiraceae bacterium]
MKKAVITGLAICLALFLCCCAVDEPMEPEHAPIAGLSDISGTEYESEILYWFDRGVITGYPDGTFLPDRPITRSEAAKLICSVSGLSLKSEILIADVSHDSWCYDAAAASTVHGIMKLYGDGTFQPHRTITRQEAMVILCRASGISSDSPEPALESIEDAEDIKSWARESVAALLERSIISPDAAGRVRPTGAMSRGEFAAILARIDETLEWASPSAVFDASYVSWISDADPGAAVKPQAVAGEYWLFLPSSADRHSTSLVISDILSDAEITFSGNKASSSSMPFDVTELADPENSGEYVITVSVSDGSSSVSLDYRLLFSERVSSVFLSSSEPDTAGRSFVELGKENAVTGYMTMLSSDGAVIYSGGLTQIRLRGNSTTYYPKKSYQIKLEKKADLLEMSQRSKTWTLLAQYADATLIRDKLCKDLAADLGIYGNPDAGWVDLYYDGAYRGTYELSEKVKVDPNVLFIPNLEKEYERVNEDYAKTGAPVDSVNKYGTELHFTEGVIDPPDITSGFLLEENHYKGDEACWFKTTRGRAVNVKSPEKVSEAAMIYISELYQELEDAAYAQDSAGRYTGVNPATGKDYSEYVDVDSLARMYLIYYFSNNQDAYVQSTFYFLYAGKLYAGPMWDSDQSFGIGWTEPTLPSDELRFDHIVGGLVNVPSFRETVKSIYESEFRSLALAYANERLWEYADLISGTERSNHVVWPKYFTVSGVKSVFPDGSVYTDAVSYASDWMKERISYMDAKLADW